MRKQAESQSSLERGKYYSTMSGRGHGGRYRNTGGRGHFRQNVRNSEHIYAPPGGTNKAFQGLNTKLPALDFGNAKSYKPVEFLREIGEHCAVTYQSTIADAFVSIPPCFSESDAEPTYPSITTTGKADLTHQEKALVQTYLNAHKTWYSEEVKAKNDKMTVFSVVYGQLSESSRCEVQDDERWAKSFKDRDLIYLITRIRATHIAAQTGNLAQDQERVRGKWYSMMMSSTQTSYSFRREVEEYQLERIAVGLPEIPSSELIIGILNRVDQARFGHVKSTYLANQRLNIGTFPTEAHVVWKELKDSQVQRYNSTNLGHYESVFVTRTDEHTEHRGRGRGGRSGRGGGRGRTYTARGRGHYETTPQPKPDTSPGKGEATPARSESITPWEITCWECGKKGHKKSECTLKKAYFIEETTPETAFLTTIETFNSREEELAPTPTKNKLVLLSSKTHAPTTLLLDTQASVHIVSNAALLEDIFTTTRPINIQGITKDVTHVTLMGKLRGVGIEVYHSTLVAANILSYSELQKTHRCSYTGDTFTAAPKCNGPELVFVNIGGHYTMDVTDMIKVYSMFTAERASRYNDKQVRGAKRAYEFLERMGFISYKAAAEVLRRSSLADIGFSRADLVRCQDIYGRSAAYQMGHGTQASITPGEDDPIPTHESIDQELQVDMFFIFGQVFFLSISVIMGLIMITHLGPAQGATDRSSEKSKAKAGQCLIDHIAIYVAHGFTIKRVTSDGEASIKAVRHEIELQGVEVNILGHGSHTPHAEAAIRHVKNKARSTVASLPYVLPTRWAATLLMFVAHTVNMVPRSSAPGHISAYTSFTGRIPSFKKHAPFAFGTAGFLQRPSGAQSNTAQPRADYCIWLGTTRNLAGTHLCCNLSTLQLVTGDIFRPAPLTPDAADRLSRLAGSQDAPPPVDLEPLIHNPSPPYSLDPNRGVNNEAASTPAEQLAPSGDGDGHQGEVVSNQEHDEEVTADESALQDSDTAQVLLQVSALATMRSDTATTQQHPTHEVYAAMSIKEAISKYGDESVALAGRTELLNCISKGVWECVPKNQPSAHPIPSKLFLTAKHTTTGEFKLLKGRIVGGGHRQDVTMFTEAEISSPTVALTSVMIGAAVASHHNEHVMTLDHTAAYLNADMKGPTVEMMLSPDVVKMLCDIDEKYKIFIRENGKIIVRLKKALYGCVQSAVLWYNELKSTLVKIGFRENPYDVCSFTRARGISTDRILVYVDDLFITSDSEQVLDDIDETLRKTYGGVTSKKGKLHEYLGIRWDFSIPGQVSLSMQGYVNDIFAKYTVPKSCKVPANDQLFEISDSSPPLSNSKREDFHSIVMTLHYLAKRVRPDILTAVSWCASRVLNPTEEDEAKLDRVLGYLQATRTNGTVLKIGEKMEIRAYVDASYAVYCDAKSVSGIVLMLGDAVIYVKSSKQKIVTRSSTESELVAISDSLSQILWTREYMIYNGITVGPAVLFQDNMSTIFLANKGKSTSERTRHIKIRYFFIHHYIDSKEIVIVHMPTVDMIADIMTKPLHGALFEKLSAVLTGKKNIKE